MSLIQTSASRDPYDLSHFGFKAGKIGKLKVIDFIPMVAGDSIDYEIIGSHKLSPLRRGLVLDTKTDICTFFVPYRYMWDQWEQFLMDGDVSGQYMPVYNITPDTDPEQGGSWRTNFLGTKPSSVWTIPSWLYDAYVNIFNNYFRPVWAPFRNPDINTLTEDEALHGFNCANLKNIWTAPLDPVHQTDAVVNTSGDSMSIAELQFQAADLHHNQQVTAYMRRYRDVVESFGGKTTPDADQRAWLLMRSEFWSSGYDVNGTSQESLGQYSGRVQQTFSHSMPRWYCPEHGVLMTVQLTRFPPISTNEIHFLVGNPTPGYMAVAGDPIYDANVPPAKIAVNFFHQGTNLTELTIPWSQWYRTHPSHVDILYDSLQGFPFIHGGPNGLTPADVVHCDPSKYEECFQTTQLGHWNSQQKVNATVYRQIPTARDNIFTDSGAR